MHDQDQSGPSSGPPFVGTSPDESINADEEPDLMLAIDRAAEDAGRAGYTDPLVLTVEVEAKTTNQWIRTLRAKLDEAGR